MPKKILIIEDEKPLAEEWKLSFGAEGYSVEIWSKVLEVLNGLEHLEYDLVLLDIMLPTIDAVGSPINLEEIEYGRTAGVWLCKLIKKKKPSLPIVVVSVVRDRNILENIRSAGADLILNKPIAVDEIIESIKLLLIKKQ